VAKRKHSIHSILVIFLLFAFIAQPLQVAALAGEQSSQPFAQPALANPHWQEDPNIPETFDLVAENEMFQLYVDETTIAFKVLDKRSGYVWHSNLDEKGEDDRLNRTWTAFAQSGISIDYLDQGAISERASITNSEHTIDVQRVEQGVEASVTFTVPSITLVIMIILEEHGVRVEVPSASIKEENPDFKLGMLHVYPFFGATRDDSVPGYMFLPDGCGSIIRFNSTTKADNMFYGRYYGPDLGMLTTLPYDPMVNRPFKISIPVIGMVHGEKENAYIAILEQGASYGEIHAHPAGIITNFNFLYNTFIYNESYFQATNRSGAGVTTLQQQTNAFDVVMHYRFLTQADSDYVGMARSYQQYLVEKGVLEPIATQPGDISIRLEFLGSEKEHILFWDRSIPMTTISQLRDILNDLNIYHPQVVYYGWQPLGASSMPPTSLRLDRQLGNEDELRSLVDSIAAQEGNFYLYLDPQAALFDEGGYSPRHDLAMSITNFNLMGYNRGNVNYYLNFDALSARYNDLSQAVYDELGTGLALDGIGSMLYSDFKRNNFLNRQEAISAYQSLLEDTAGTTSFYIPNDYMFGYMQAYYDIPLSNSGYIYTTDAVPFLQIVLAGYVPYYGTALNFSSDMQGDLLKHVDFGVYPSFFLSHEVTAKILNTNSSWIYTSSISQWSQEVERVYEWLNNLLGPVQGQSIVARQVLQQGVVATTYANGLQIIVNYNDTSASIDDLVIGGKDAVLREVLP
jgi:hypothetical protein